MATYKGSFAITDNKFVQFSRKECGSEKVPKALKNFILETKTI